MHLVELTEEEFNAFSINHPLHTFCQSIRMFHHLKEMKKETYLLGMKNNEEILCASLITLNNSGKHKKFIAPRGFLIDYENLELLKQWTKQLTLFIKKRGGFMLLIEPYIAVEKVNENTNSNITFAGYRKFFQEVNPMLNYCLDIKGSSSEEIFKKFVPNTRNYINKTINKYALEIKTLQFNELKEFKQITQETASRRGFEDKSLFYYESIFKNFKEKVLFKIVSLNCDTYLAKLEEDQKLKLNKINELSNSVSNKNKKKSLEEEIIKNKQEIVKITNLKQEKGNIIALAGAMFILDEREIFYMFSGSYEEYFKYFGQYLLQWDIIKYACDHNYDRYNFLGVKETGNKNSEDYGVYEFKKSFGGYIEKLIGSFEKPCSFRYYLYLIKQKLKRRS